VIKYVGILLNGAVNRAHEVPWSGSGNTNIFSDIYEVL